ncbi:ring-opening amidohydrolase [Candidatus Nitrosacidococcus sp. I8]|uniref:cyanuric acid amidohydrolase n=1 Tax=Candidatus Nitrosacidococcus sp. I8 TaxID=2942908 RepID=UPI002225D193|nr:ring-opening amidohydrolase [Candidatus Nitrosacidococcus sp. I8]CAH9018603.1 Cyanuric acid amidohydrolase [Candidatus Nitrosacidococcus sp. I8]
MKVEIYRLSMNNPGDAQGLQQLLDSNVVKVSQIIAIIGKTEGNGGANDFTRALATHTVSEALGKSLGISPAQVTKQIVIAWSGGCEGVLSPHMTVFTRDMSVTNPNPSDEKRLVISAQQTKVLKPEQIGRMPHVMAVAKAVGTAVEELGIAHQDIHYVQVKGPLLTPEAIASTQAQGKDVVTEDPNLSKKYARGAMGLGVAVGLKEIPQNEVTEEAIAHDMSLYSSVASTSAGGEINHCEVVVFGNSSTSTSQYRIGHAALASVTDIEGVRAAILSAGLHIRTEATKAEAQQIAAIFAKAEAPIHGVLWGQRTTMLSDADIHYERNARAALGAVITSVTHDPRIFVSGATEH